MYLRASGTHGCWCLADPATKASSANHKLCRNSSPHATVVIALLKKRLTVLASNGWDDVGEDSSHMQAIVFAPGQVHALIPIYDRPFPLTKLTAAMRWH